MTVAILAFLIDCVIGDPKSAYHPVALIGHVISSLEQALYRVTDNSTQKFFAGFILTVLVLLISYDVPSTLMRFVNAFHLPHLSLAVEALLLSFTISPKSLAQAAMQIRALLMEKNIPEARHQVGYIVGRDTNKLDEEEIARATVETVAENITDGIISPLCFYLLGGLPLAYLYRAANTMDSMIGYKNAKYFWFGKAAARLDDVLNYIPARLTGCLLCLAALFLRLHVRAALKYWHRDAAKHPSPNGGHAEAPMAGALGIRLGGWNQYFGQRHFRAYMGEAKHPIGAKDIQQAVRMMYTATLLFLLLAYGLSIFLPKILTFFFAF